MLFRKSGNALAGKHVQTGNQPVRAFLLSLSKEDRKEVGSDIFAVQIGFPIRLWEIRSNVKDGICRILFSVEENSIILLHGFIKKTQKTPKAALELARERMKEVTP